MEGPLRDFGETRPSGPSPDRYSGDVDPMVAERNQPQAFQVLNPDDGRLDPLLVAAFTPEHPVARTARDLRAMLSAARKLDGNPPKTIVVLGVDAAAEAAVLTGNLAIASAQAGCRTLLVDANLTEPVQHRLFRLPNRSGLSSALAGDQDAHIEIRPCAVHGLWIMPAGPARSNATELLGNGRLYASLRPLLDDFEIILVDASHSSREYLISAGAEGALIVLRQGISSVQETAELADRLRVEGTPLIGNVMGT
jgi:Mrp family chromosome partitioning ATPase